MRKIIFLLLIVSFNIACNRKIKNDFLIPEKTFKNILLDVHLVDGYYMMNYAKFTNHNDTCNFYKQLLSGYGYTKAQFDSTVKYYTLNLKTFDDVYETVITDLNRMIQDATSIHSLLTDSARNLYKGKKQLEIDTDTTINKVPFDISIKDTGNYEITVQLKIFDDNKSINPRLSAYFWYDDKTRDGKRDNFEPVKYLSEKYPRVYKISKHLRNKKFNHLRGCFLEQDFNYSHYLQHAAIKAIVIRKI